MRKEVILAIVIGFALGLVITFGVWTANRALKEKGTEIPPTTSELTPSEETLPTAAFTLEIATPEDGELVNETKVMLAGRTQAGATIVVVGEKGEEIIETDEDGTFAIEVQLVGGTNEITVTAFSPEGEKISKTLNLVYSTAEI